MCEERHQASVGFSAGRGRGRQQCSIVVKADLPQRVSRTVLLLAGQCLHYQAAI